MRFSSFLLLNQYSCKCSSFPLYKTVKSRSICNCHPESSNCSLHKTSSDISIFMCPPHLATSDPFCCVIILCKQVLFAYLQSYTNHPTSVGRQPVMKIYRHISCPRLIFIFIQFHTSLIRWFTTYVKCSKLTRPNVYRCDRQDRQDSQDLDDWQYNDDSYIHLPSQCRYSNIYFAPSTY